MKTAKRQRTKRTARSLRLRGVSPGVCRRQSGLCPGRSALGAVRSSRHLARAQPPIKALPWVPVTPAAPACTTARQHDGTSKMTTARSEPLSQQPLLSFFRPAPRRCFAGARLFCLFSAAAGAFEGKARTGPVAATLQHGRRTSQHCHLALLATPQILGCFAPIEVTGVRVGLYGTDRGSAMASDRVYVDNDSGGRIHAGLRGAMRGSWHAAGCRLSAFK